MKRIMNYNETRNTADALIAVRLTELAATECSVPLHELKEMLAHYWQVETAKVYKDKLLITYYEEV